MCFDNILDLNDLYNWEVLLGGLCSGDEVCDFARESQGKHYWVANRLPLPKTLHHWLSTVAELNW